MKKSSIRQARYFRSTGRKVVMALALASAISGLSISSALADSNDNYDGPGNSGHHENYGQSKKHGDRDGYDGYQLEYRQPYIYAQPVYAPPPVYYEPQPSVGISLFFPLDLR